jgi:hypothetical protein
MDVGLKPKFRAFPLILEPLNNSFSYNETRVELLKRALRPNNGSGRLLLLNLRRKEP